MASGSGDQRRAKRYNVKNFELHCFQGGVLSMLGAPRKIGTLPVVNFSVGGAQFLSHREFASGDRVKVRLSGPMQAEPVELDGEICWCRQVPRRSAYRIGLRFVAPGVASQGRLHLLEAHLGELTIRLVCPGCGAAFAVRKRFEGQVGRCPKCRATVEVMDEELLPELPEEKQVFQEKARAESRKVPAVSPLAPNVNRVLAAFIATSISSRTHLEVIQHFAKRPAGQVAGVSELSMILTVPEPRMRAILRELAAQGILKEIGAKTFNYDPSPDAKRKIAELATLLANPSRRAEVLALVLEAEKGGGAR